MTTSIFFSDSDRADFDPASGSRRLHLRKGSMSFEGVDLDAIEELILPGYCRELPPEVAKMPKLRLLAAPSFGGKITKKTLGQPPLKHLFLPKLSGALPKYLGSFDLETLELGHSLKGLPSWFNDVWPSLKYLGVQRVSKGLKKATERLESGALLGLDSNDEQLIELALTHHEVTHIGGAGLSGRWIKLFEPVRETLLTFESGPQKVDVSALAGFTALKRLGLRGPTTRIASPLCRIASLAPIASLLPQLESLTLKGALIEDLSPLSAAKELKRLELTEASSSDLRPLSECSALRYLDVEAAPISCIPQSVLNLPELHTLITSRQVSSTDEGTPLADFPGHESSTWNDGKRLRSQLDRLGATYPKDFQPPPIGNPLLAFLAECEFPNGLQLPVNTQNKVLVNGKIGVSFTEAKPADESWKRLDLPEGTPFSDLTLDYLADDENHWSWFIHTQSPGVQVYVKGHDEPDIRRVGEFENFLLWAKP